MLKITPALLKSIESRSHKDSKDAATVVGQLGNLSRWWLQESPLQLAACLTGIPAFSMRPQLPTSVGSCWIICGVPQPSPWLRPACLLPLKWQRGGHGHSRRLPKCLRELADQVLEQTEKSKTLSPNSHNVNQQWELHPHQTLGDLDLSELDECIRVESGWGSLYGGLSLAWDGITPDPTVGASVAWDSQWGIGSVELIKQKLEEAVSIGIQILFLPAQNTEEASHIRRDREWDQLQIQPLKPSADNLRPEILLKEYLEKNGAPPDLTEDFSVRCAYYSRLQGQKSQEYYWTHLLNDDVTTCQEHFTRVYPDCQPQRLVTIASLRPGIVCLSSLVTKVEQCLLFYDQQQFGGQHQKTLLDQMESRLESAGIRVQFEPLTLNDRLQELEAIKRVTQNFVTAVDPSTVAIDLTPGFKSLSFWLREQAQPGNWLLYCRHDQLAGDQKPKPGSQRYDCWQVTPPR